MAPAMADAIAVTPGASVVTGGGSLSKACPDGRGWLLARPRRRDPAVHREKPPQPRIVDRERRKPLAAQGASPPVASPVAGWRELVSEEAGADVAGRVVGEGVVGKQAEGPRVVVEELPDEMQGPGVMGGGRHGGEPDLPVDAILVGSHDARPARDIPGLALELVGAPRGVLRDRRLVGALEDDLV